MFPRDLALFDTRSGNVDASEAFLEASSIHFETMFESGAGESADAAHQTTPETPTLVMPYSDP